MTICVSKYMQFSFHCCLPCFTFSSERGLFQDYLGFYKYMTLHSQRWSFVDRGSYACLCLDFHKTWCARIEMNITSLQEGNGFSPLALTSWKKENDGSCFSPEAAVATAAAVTPCALSVDEIGQAEGWLVLGQAAKRNASALHDSHVPREHLLLNVVTWVAVTYGSVLASYCATSLWKHLLNRTLVIYWLMLHGSSASGQTGWR